MAERAVRAATSEGTAGPAGRSAAWADGEVSGGEDRASPAQPELDRRQPPGQCGVCASAAGAGDGVHGRAGTVPARGAARHSAAHQGRPAHVQFETIPPFLDGNGRLGRLLITFLLCAANTLREPILYLRLYFKTRRSAYYDLLDRARTKGEWEAWLDFFLSGVRETAEQAAAAARRIVALLDEHRRQIETLGRPAGSALRIFQHMQRNPIVSIPATALKTGISARTAAKSLEHMRRLGIVREITGRPRRRLFVYDAYLAILNEGTKPIG